MILFHLSRKKTNSFIFHAFIMSVDILKKKKKKIYVIKEHSSYVTPSSEEKFETNKEVAC